MCNSRGNSRNFFIYEHLQQNYALFIVPATVFIVFLRFTLFVSLIDASTSVVTIIDLSQANTTDSAIYQLLPQSTSGYWEYKDFSVRGRELCKLWLSFWVSPFPNVEDSFIIQYLRHNPHQHIYTYIYPRYERKRTICCSIGVFINDLLLYRSV